MGADHSLRVGDLACKRGQNAVNRPDNVHLAHEYVAKIKTRVRQGLGQALGAVKPVSRSSCKLPLAHRIRIGCVDRGSSSWTKYAADLLRHPSQVVPEVDHIDREELIDARVAKRKAIEAGLIKRHPPF